MEAINLNKNTIKITFKNDFTRTIDSSNVRNFGTMLDWVYKFNNNEKVSPLTVSGRDLGSALVLNENNIKKIELL